MRLVFLMNLEQYVFISTRRIQAGNHKLMIARQLYWGNYQLFFQLHLFFQQDNMIYNLSKIDYDKIIIMQELRHEDVLDKVMKDYYIYKFLGEGSTSKVYLAIRENTVQKLAIKVIPKQYLNSDKKIYELVKTEIYILKNHNSENIVKCYDVFQSPESIFIVTEYCDSIDLQHYLKSKKFLSEDNAVMFLRQILNGFKALHELDMMHRDFKLANILLNSDKICKIADLGYAKKLKQGTLTQSILGTYITMAPQVIKGKPYGLGADIWSIGVVFYQMIFGNYPYKGFSSKDLLKNIQTKQLNFSSIRVSKQCEDFIVACLTQDETKRITWPQIYKHPLIARNSMQLHYGVFLPISNLEEIQKFYHRKTAQFQNPESLILMNSSLQSRKLVIQQIIQRTQSGRDSSSIMRSTIDAKDYHQTNLKCAKKYIMYLNSISHPFKYLTRKLLKKLHLAHLQNSQYLLLIYHKAMEQLKEYEYIVNKQINLFHLKEELSAFLQSKYYTIIKKLIIMNIRKAELAIEKVEQKNMQKSLKHISKKQSQSTVNTLNSVGQKEFKATKYHSEKNNQIFFIETQRFLRQIQSIKLVNSKQIDTWIQFIYPFLFYLSHQGKTAEQFDTSFTRKRSAKEDIQDIQLKIKQQLTLITLG